MSVVQQKMPPYARHENERENAENLTVPLGQYNPCPAINRVIVTTDHQKSHQTNETNNLNRVHKNDVRHNAIIMTTKLDK